jgi:hypothetical protein
LTRKEDEVDGLGGGTCFDSVDDATFVEVKDTYSACGAGGSEERGAVCAEGEGLDGLRLGEG